ncbi:hypothetical protein VME_45740 [Vibrio harveyi 1DA3]|nr:hypothetical protein VME_45740 [Vibrio harveyi 1DA3]
MAGITLEELEINFKANSAQFSKDLNRINRELDKQRKQLKKNEKAANSFSKEFNNFSKGLNTTIGRFKALSGSVAAVFAGIVAGSVAISNNVRELDNLARQTGVNIKQFRALEFAARQYGMTGEQIADITKDIKDKAQEFARDGTGAFTDFATEAGLTSEQARRLAGEMVNLSGDKAMGLMIKRMEELGLNSNEMVQALESMGNDASKLTPLFANNGKEISRLTEKMRALTGVLDENEINTYRSFSESIELVKGSFLSLAENALTPVIKKMTTLAEKWAHLIASFNQETIAAKTTRLADISDELSDLRDAATNTETAWGRFKNVLSFDVSDKGYIQHQIDTLIAEREKLQDEVAKLSTGSTITEIKSGTGGGSGSKAGTGGSGSSSDSEINEVILSEEKKLATRNEFAIRERELLAQATEDKFDDLKVAQERENEAVRLKYEGMRDELEQSGITEAEIQQRITDEKLAIEESYKEQRDELREEMKEAQYEELTEFQESYNNMLESLNESFSNSVANWIVEGGSFKDAMKGVFKSVLKSFIAMLIQQQLQKLIFDKLAAKKKAAEEQGKVAALTSQATAQGTASMAGAPFPINLGAPAFGVAMGAIAGAAQQSAAAAYAGLVGIAHDGMSNIPKEGTWLLNGGERVVAPEQNKDLTQFLDGKKQGVNDLQMTVNINANNNVSIDEFFESNIQNYGDQIGIAALEFIERAV